MKNRDQIKELVELIIKHKHAYYSGSPIISDAEYDKIEDQLRALDPDHPALSFIGSNSNNQKIAHQTKMLSLQKTYSIDELTNWADQSELLASLKIDGNSLSLVYENGKLLIAKTRGDGSFGEDVTDKSKWIGAIPNQISFKKHLEVRGELYCTMIEFNKLSQQMSELNLEPPTNPRNIVAGILSRKGHIELARFFDFFAFDLLGDIKVHTEIDKLNKLSSLGFKTAPFQFCRTKDDIENFIKTSQEQADDLEFAIDGCVFTLNDLKLHHELGETSHHPRYKMVYKWPGDTAHTTIESIDWATSRMGIVTPVAKIKPVYLSGATITNVSLHNSLYVKTYHLKRGDIIEIIRSGEVIPKFLRVIQSSPTQDLEILKHCPSCSDILIDDGVRLKCLNKSKCPAQKSGKILNWIQSVSIEDLSDKRLEQMISSGLVQDIPDLYKLTEEQLLTLANTKTKLATKIIHNIKASTKPSLSSFLTGLGIPNMGESSWNKLIQHHNTLQQILELTKEDITQIDGFAEKTAESIVTGLADLYPLIKDLLSVGVIPGISRFESRQTKISGKSIAITGALSKPRKEIESAILAAGGSPTSSISNNTYVLICNEPDSASSKMQKAKKLGIPIWSEEQLWENLK